MLSNAAAFLNHIQRKITDSLAVHGLVLHVPQDADDAQLLIANPSAEQEITDHALKGVAPAGLGTSAAAGYYTPLGANGKFPVDVIPVTGGGGGGDTYYVHTQASPAATWNVVHNLGSTPVVQIVDAAGHVVEVDVEHLTVNTLTVSANIAFAGQAICTV